MDKVVLGVPDDPDDDDDNNKRVVRGLRARIHLEAGDEILSPLPWNRVLGVFAARHFMDAELCKGRGIFECPTHSNHKKKNNNDQEESVTTWWKRQLIQATHGKALRLWSCTLACALLTALRYPLSSWSCYVASLPFLLHETDDHEGRIARALGRTRMALVKQARRRQRLEERQRQKEAQKQQQQEQEEEPLQPSVSTTSTTTTNQEALSSQLPSTKSEMDSSDLPQEVNVPSSQHHVLAFSQQALEATGDMALMQTVQVHNQWLYRVWKALFVVSNDDEPLVSWESWVWAHAMVISRAVAVPRAPAFVCDWRHPHEDSVSYLTGSTVPGVLLPVIDLINHADSSSSSHTTKSSTSKDKEDAATRGVPFVEEGSNAALHVTQAGVSVRATREIRPGEQVLFDYHPGASLHLMLHNYGFVPSNSRVHNQTWSVGPHLTVSVSQKLQDTKDTANNDEDSDKETTLDAGMMMRLQHVWVDSKQHVTLVISNHDGCTEPDEEDASKQQQVDLMVLHASSDSLEWFVSYQNLATHLCRLAMQAYAPLSTTTTAAKTTDTRGESSALELAMEYRQATFRLFEHAFLDLFSCSQLLSSTTNLEE